MVSCILLAAGESRRFGRPKPLAPLGPETVIEFIQRRLLLTDVAEIIVVLGAESGSIAPHIFQDQRIKSVMNENYALGQTSSFKTGLSAVNPQVKGVMLLPVDVPLIKPETFNTLIDAFLKRSCTILLPTYKGRSGHPPIFSRDLEKELMNLKNEEPLSSIQHKYKTQVLRFPVDDESIVLSFNTPEEFKELLTLSGLFQA